MKVPKKAHKITKPRDIRPRWHRNPAVKTAISPSMHAKKKTA